MIPGVDTRIAAEREGQREPRAHIAFARGLLAQYNVQVLPGSLLAREVQGHNPGAGRIRVALVAPADDCLEAARRIVSYTRGLS